MVKCQYLTHKTDLLLRRLQSKINIYSEIFILNEKTSDLCIKYQYNVLTYFYTLYFMLNVISNNILIINNGR